MGLNRPGSLLPRSELELNTRHRTEHRAELNIGATAL
jgi:hypothetical protein